MGSCFNFETKKPEFTKDWTLFLDRDGVINERIPDDYVKTTEGFIFTYQAREALAILSQLFNKIIVVTNQQGIGRGLMTHDQLHIIHDYMKNEVCNAGGRIDAIYFSPDLKDTGSFTRKPAIGMGLEAKKDFPGINFEKSIMVGDTYSDMLFGERLGMCNVLITNDSDIIAECGKLPGQHFPDLFTFASFVKEHFA
jgi:histidinol-phosphate phosphatase family protein